MSPIREMLKRWNEEEIRQTLQDIEHIRTTKTWPNGVPIPTAGEQSQEIAILRAKLDQLNRDLERLQ